MKVYEMIQELSKFDADMDVEINVIADDYKVDSIKIEKEYKMEEEVSADVSFDEDITDFEIGEHNRYRGNRIVRITAVVE